MVYGISSTSIARYGEEIARQSFSLATVTGNTSDSLVFLTQTIVYPSPRKIMSFPMTFGNIWSSGGTSNTNFLLTATAYGLNKTPGFRRSTTLQKDTVKGWGRIRVRKMDGTTSGWVDVLAVKSHLNVADSFYLGGSPAPAALLSLMGLTQGMQDNRYYVNYFRAGEVESLLSIVYSDASFNTIDAANAQMNHLATATSTTGIATTPGATMLRAYPNPAPADGFFAIELTESATGDWRYLMLNEAGQVTANAPISATGGKASISTAGTVPGNYILSVTKDGETVGTKRVVVGK